MEKITIKGYKSIKELSLEIRPINILIGANGSGKSNFLSFFEFLNQINNRNLQEYSALKGIDTFLHKGAKVTDQISGHLQFPNTNAYSFTLKKGALGFVFTQEKLWYEKNSYDNQVEISSFGTESELNSQTIPRANFIRKYLKQFSKYHFHDTGENSPFNKESNIENDKFFLYEKGSNLAAFLFTIQKENPITYNLIVKTIQSIAPFFLDFYLKPESNGNLKLRWQNRYSSTVFSVSDLSDGTLRFIALTVLFLQPELPETIIIDEPELGLHPKAITKLSGLISAAAQKNCKVIIATQSTDLIGHFEPEDIITVDLKNGESVFERLDSVNLKNWLDEYTIDDLWKKSIISSGQPNIYE